MRLLFLVFAALAAALARGSRDSAPGGTGGAAGTVTACGIPPVSVGCCPCVAPACDSVQCM